MAGIRIEGLSKDFGGPAVVSDVDLSIASGDFVVILGPSGCGKSTLLRMIAGLEEQGAGTISIDGEPMEGVPPGRRGCAMVFQNYALYPHMSVAGNIGYALKVAGVPRAEREARVREVAAMLELEPLLERRPHQLSGGQRQRVAMGRAMVRRPRVFLFDEPLSNLDARLRLQMRLEIKRLHRALGATSIFVTHDQLEAMTMADRLVVMEGGRIRQAGAPGEVWRRPASRFVAGFVGTPPMIFFPARIDREGRARAAGGWEPCPGARWRLPEGAALELGVRPQDIAADPSGPGPRFTPDLAEDMGAELHIHARAPGGEAVTLIRRAGEAAPSAPFAVRIPAAHVHAFRAEDGARAEPEPVATESETQ
ncbi:MAG: ABC transporter ATP-binding protein [Pikeienuella sp.]|uniref:ABC transporter ATP-binding protein n=1 Tax=Pikeienuella sp. TaxID=2831957 RepID=UPI003919BDD0